MINLNTTTPNINFRKGETLSLLNFHNQVDLIIPTDLHIKEGLPSAVTLIVALVGIPLHPLRDHKGLCFPVSQDGQSFVTEGHTEKETPCLGGEGGPDPLATKGGLPL